MVPGGAVDVEAGSRGDTEEIGQKDDMVSDEGEGQGAAGSGDQDVKVMMEAMAKTIENLKKEIEELKEKIETAMEGLDAPLKEKMP